MPFPCSSADITLVCLGSGAVLHAVTPQQSLQINICRFLSIILLTVLLLKRGGGNILCNTKELSTTQRRRGEMSKGMLWFWFVAFGFLHATRWMFAPLCKKSGAKAWLLSTLLANKVRNLPLSPPGNWIMWNQAPPSYWHWAEFHQLLRSFLECTVLTCSRWLVLAETWINNKGDKGEAGLKATAVSYGLLNKFRLLLLRGWAFVFVQRNEQLWELNSDMRAE